MWRSYCEDGWRMSWADFLLAAIADIEKVAFRVVEFNTGDFINISKDKSNGGKFPVSSRISNVAPNNRKYDNICWLTKCFITIEHYMPLFKVQK
jgi:hypothetical protein